MPTTPPGKALATLPKLDLRILSDGRAGHETQMFGIAESLGLTPGALPELSVGSWRSTNV